MPTQYQHKLNEDCIHAAQTILKEVNSGKSYCGDSGDDNTLFLALKAVMNEKNARELQNLILQNWVVKQSIKKENKGKIKWDDNALRELSLAGMMISLFIKRLESSWTSCLSTLKAVRTGHETWLSHAENRTNADFNDEDGLARLIEKEILGA